MTKASETAAVEFVLEEAKALNEARYTDWLANFSDDGCYWVPRDGDRQADALNHASLAYEDRLLLAIRVQRLGNPRAHSMEPGVRSVHVIQQPRIEQQVDSTAVEYRLSTPFIYTESRGERQLTLVGTWRHRLKDTPQGLRIVLKRVDLLNAAAAHEAIYLFP